MRFALKAAGTMAAASIAAVLLPAPALAKPGGAATNSIPAAVKASSGYGADYGIVNFYKRRGFQPLWFRDGRPLPEVRQLAAMLHAASRDGMSIDPDRLDAVERAAAGDVGDTQRAELLLSGAWVDYVQAMTRPVEVGMTYIDASLSPTAAFPAAILAAAASAPSLEHHLADTAKRNPLHEKLNEGLSQWRARWGDLPRHRVASGSPLVPGGSGPRVEALRTRLGLSVTGGFDAEAANVVIAFKRAHGLPSTPVVDAATLDVLNQDPAAIEARLRLNIDRVRALPSDRAGKYIVVDAAAARLFLYEDGQVRDSMKVVVGKVTEQTPMAAGLIRSMVLNPYWNVPPDLVRKSVATKVLDQGLGYLRQARFEVLSGWDEDARVIDPAEVDWAAVAAGGDAPRVRQLPGPGNAMGAMKFLFPNSFGVYLHDTPDKNLFAASDRALSSGCVRLEDAKRLAKWLFGTLPTAASGKAEQVVALARAVPVYLTYLTAGWDGADFVMRPDIYGRDQSWIRNQAAARVGKRPIEG